MIKRALFALLVAVILLAAIIGVEVFAALRREYLPTEPALDVKGEFGSASDPQLRFAVLGDSTSVGVGVDSHEHAYPYLLAQWLAERDRHVVLRTFGVSGARVENVLAEQVAQAEEFDPDLVFVGIGANDVTHATSLGDIRRDIGIVLDRLLATGATVVLAGAPDMRADAWLEPLRSIAGWQGRRVTSAIEAEGRARGVTIVPLAKETAPFFEAEPELANSADEFHPGRAGYRRWAEVIYPYLERALAESDD